MYKIDFNNPIHIHFIGIGGISMSGLAKILYLKVLLFQALMLTHQLLLTNLSGTAVSYPYHRAPVI